MTALPEGQLSFRCPHCSKKLRTQVKAVGRRFRCPHCGQQVTVPEPQSVQGAQSSDNGSQIAIQAASEEPAATRTRPNSFDVDELILEEPAIDNLQERQMQSRSIQEAKAAEQRRRLAAEQQRQVPHAGPQEVVQPHSRRQVVEAQLRDAYTLLEPDEGQRDSQAASPASSSESGGKSDSPEQIKKTAFDDDLPDLVRLPDHPQESPSTSAEAELDKIVATLGKHAINLDLENLTQTEVQDSFEDKYRVTCPTCGTIQYVIPAAKGSRLKCPDCTSKFTVPPPPPNWKPSRVRTRHDQFNDQSPLADADELTAVNRQKKQQTQAMLDRAEVELSEEEKEGRLYGEDFDTPGFLRRTFGFVLDPVAVGIIVGYSVVFAFVFAMLQFGLSSDGSAFQQGVMLFCALTAPAIAILFGMPMFSAALAQLEAAANQQNRVSDWPSMNVFEHFGDVMAVSVALTAAAIPGFVIGSWLGGDLVTAGRVQITGVMLTTFLLFPIFYLSILDSGSILQLISLDVLRSVKEVGEAWGGFYLKTLIVFMFTLIVWYLLLGEGKSPMLAAMAGAMLPPLVFFTFQQLGVLAYSIGENLSPALLPEAKKSVDGQPEELESN